jgi:hypothetical protein
MQPGRVFVVAIIMVTLHAYTWNTHTENMLLAPVHVHARKHIQQIIVIHKRIRIRKPTLECASRLF